MVKQEIRFVHDPGRIRSAAIRLAAMRATHPRSICALLALLALLAVALATSSKWMLILVSGIAIAMPVIFLKYILTLPSVFCGPEIQMSIGNDGLHFAGCDRSGTIGWSGFKEIYRLNQMWAVFVKNSEAVSFIQTDQIDAQTLTFVLAKLREANVRIYGNRD